MEKECADGGCAALADECAWCETVELDGEVCRGDDGGEYVNGGFLMGYRCWLTFLCSGVAVFNWGQDAVSFAAICRDSAMRK